jgi:putative ATPase
MVGQRHLFDQGSVLTILAQPDVTGSVNSVILWGPPGTGKTTIAKAIARTSGRQFIELNAVSAGVKEVRDAISTAHREADAYGRATILFIDEIHRFNKAQQDALLAEVEAGAITLIAATTENPSFSVNGPLLSRCTLLELHPLTDDDLAKILKRAILSSDGLSGAYELDDDAAAAIIRFAASDARRALVLLEGASNLAKSSGSNVITLDAVTSVSNVAAIHYDRQGDQHYDVISAFIKSIRGSDADAALHYLARMLEAGEDPRFIARRLMISAAEDVGLADPQALVLATAAAQSVALIGMPEARIALGEITIYLALAPKSNSAYLAINQAIADVRDGISEAVPTPLRNQQPSSLKTKPYVYPHDAANAIVAQDYVGPKVQKKSYYQGKKLGFEEQLATRWLALKKIIRGH